MDRPWDHCTLVLAPHTGHPLWNLDGAAVPGRVCHSLLQVIIVIIVVLILLLLAAVVILVVLAAAVLLLAVAEARGVATVVAARRGNLGWGEDVADLVLGSPVAGVSSS